MGLTEDQKARILEKQKEAREKRQKRLELETKQTSNHIQPLPQPSASDNTTKNPNGTIRCTYNAPLVRPPAIQSNGCNNTLVNGPKLVANNTTNNNNNVHSVVVLPEADKFRITCVVLSPERFEVRTKYNVEVIKIFQTMKTKSYNAQSKNWSFSLSEYDSLVTSIGHSDVIRGQYILCRIPAWVLKILKAQPEPTPEHAHMENNIDTHLWAKLFPYQRDGIGFVLSRKGRCLIADDMGLGKTIQSIRKWMPSVNEQHVKIINTKSDYCPNLDEDSVVVMSYDLMAGLQLQLTQKKFKIVIFDESHLLKSHTAERTKAAGKVIKKTSKLLLLSGTPALSRPKELFSQLHMLMPDKFNNFHEFGTRYCAGKWEENPFRRGTQRFIAEGASNMDELHIILKHAVMIRRLKTDVIKFLPSKTRDVVILDKTQVKTDIEQLKKARIECQRADLSNGARRGALLHLYRETSVVKQKPVLAFILELLGNNDKVIVFLHHKSMMDYLIAGLDEFGINFEYIEGATTPSHRDQAVERFQTIAEIKILVQAEDRAHRLGQENDVQVKYLVASGTSDDLMWPMVKDKLAVLNAVGLSKDNFKDADTTVITDQPHETRKKHMSTLDDFFSKLVEEPITQQDLVQIETDCDDDGPPTKRRKEER